MSKSNGVQSPIYHNEGNDLEYFVNKGKVYCHRVEFHLWWESYYTPEELIKLDQFKVKL